MTLYNIQNLEHTTHTVNVKLDKGVSRLLFDYAAVTGEAPVMRLNSYQAGIRVVGTGALLGAVAVVLAGVM